MTAELCGCGHYNYDHMNMRDRCDVAYCDCKSFTSENKSTDDNPWGEGEDAE